MDRRQFGHGQAQPLDDERSRRADPLVAALFDVGHTARNLHVGGNQTAQLHPLFERIHLSDGPQIDTAVHRGTERRVADQIGRIGRRRKRIPGHPEREFREVEFGLIRHAAGIGDPDVDVDAVHRLGQRRVLETAVAHLRPKLERRKRRAAHFAARPERHRKFAAGRKIAEVAGIEGRNERKHVLELHLVAAGRDIHGHGVVFQLHPAVETYLDGVQAQFVLREGKTAVSQIGRNHRIQLRFGAAEHRNTARNQPHALGRQPQVEVGLVGRHVAPQAKRQRCGREAHARRIVLVTDRRVADPEVADRKAERRRFRIGGGLLFALSLFRSLHNVPVHPAVGEFVRMKRRLRKDDLRHLKPLVAEKRHHIHDHRNPLRGDDRIARKRLLAHQRQSLQIERSTGKMAQQADVQLLEIEPRIEHRIGLTLHNLGDLAPQHHRRHQSDHQHDGHHDGRNLHEFFHHLSVLKAKTVVSTSSNPTLR